MASRDWTDDLETWYPGTPYPRIGCVKCYRCHVIFVAGVKHHCGISFDDPEEQQENDQT